MKTQMEAILRRYGQRMALADGREIRAFVQPVREREEAAPFQVTPLGTADDGKWIYLGPEELAPGQTVTVWNRKFTVTNCRAVYVGEQVSHWWAVLTPERERAE